MQEWLYYNSVAGSFYTKKLCSRLYSIEVDFGSNKTRKSLVELRLRGLRGNVCIPPMLCVKKRH